MTDSTQRPRRKGGKNLFTTKSGKTIRVNRTLGERMRASREAKAQRKAAYLSTLPKEPWKRFLYRMQPKRLYKYWFSRDGAIMALKVAGIGFVVIFLLIVGLFAYFRKDLPKIRDLNSGNSGGSIAYYDRTGKILLFQDYDAFKRIPVSDINGISPYMRDATISVEDKDFYHEGAFNIKGITRAALNNLRGGSTQGGSTITQQLVKLNEGWTNDHTISRKVKELILAVELEREYSKNDILTAYLNMAPYSGTDVGVEAAAEDYFHTDAKDLSLPQAAMLAAIPKAPGAYSPYNSPNWNSSINPADNYFDSNGLIARQQYILDQMAKQGYITQAQADAAKKVDILAQVQQMPTSHYAGMKPGFAYAVLSAKEELAKDFPASVIKTGGWKVTTTIDVNLQNLANQSLNDNARRLHGDSADDASFVAEDNTTGQIVALVGGMDFNSQQLNFATDAPISPGSSIKPYSYAAFINDNNNVGAGSMLYDNKKALPGYPCTNPNTPESSNPGNCLFDDTRRNYGTVTLRYALGSSLNIPAVKAFTSTDPKDTSTAADGSTWRQASIKNSMSTVNALMGSSDAYKCYVPGTILTAATTADETPCGAAAGIGNEAYTTLADHVNGIASIARMGQVIPQTMILKVTNAAGKTLRQFQQPKPKQVVRADAAYIVTNMAADPGASYLSGHCSTTSCTGMKFHRYKGWQNAIKTGTNQDLDGLMMSWNTKYTAGVWIGNYDRSPYGGNPENVTDYMMKEFMEGAIDNLGNVKPANWTQPSDIKTLPAFRSSIPFPGSESPAPSTDLFPSWYVGKTTYTSQTLDKVSGLVATSCTPTLARETTSNSGGQWNVDIYMGGHPNVTAGTNANTTSNTPTATDNVHSCGDSPPTATITAINGQLTSSGTPTCQANQPCQILVHVEQGTHALTDSNYPDYPGTLTLLVNGQTVQSEEVDSTGDYTINYTPAAGTTGNLTVQAQVTDSVLYQGSDTQSVTIKSTGPTSYNPSTSGGGNGGGPGKGKNGTLASFPRYVH